MDIKSLLKVFSDHEAQAKEGFEENVKSFLKSNPGQELPEHMSDCFNLPAALKVICEEIVLIKEKLGMK